MESPFMDKATPPESPALADALGRSFGRWEELRAGLSADHGPLTETWKFSKHWTLQVRTKRRTVLWMSPRPKHFLASAAFGEKAVAAVKASELPASVKELVATAEKYAEGRAVRVEVRTRADAGVLRRLAALRMGT